MTFSFDTIAAFLDISHPEEFHNDERTRASVAMIFREGQEELELLLIQRSTDESDPWSGNLAFPGGRFKPDEDARRAAERETGEEIGLDLSNARYLGRLPDVHGAHLPLRVSCLVYGLHDETTGLVLNGEVSDTFWIGIDDLAVPERHIISSVSFGGEAFEVPAIYIPRPDTPVLWGLTHRLVMQFLHILRSRDGRG